MSVYDDSVQKQWTIEYDDKVLTNTDLRSSGIIFNSTLCSEQSLKFGACESNEFSATITNNGDSLLGKRVLISVEYDGKKVTFPPITIDSDKLNADRTSRTIGGHDDLYFIINSDYTEWFSNYPYDIFTMGDFRRDFFSFIGIETEEMALPNDYVIFYKQAVNRTVTGKDILTAICEINGCFGHIMNDGKFHFVILNNQIKPSETLFPSKDIFTGMEETAYSYEKTYKSMAYEDYEVARITGVVMVTSSGNKEHNFQVGRDASANNYYMENVLTLCIPDDVTEYASRNFVDTVETAVFTPVELTTRGNPELEVGEPIKAVHRNGQQVTTFVMNRTLSGAQSLTDTISSQATEFQNASNNSISRQVSTLQNQFDWSKYMIDENTVVVGNLVADHVSVASLNAVSARVGTLEADHVKVQDLNAATARIGSLEADHVSVSSFNALSATVSVINANYITANYITADVISSKFLSPSAGSMTMGTIRASNFYMYDGANYVRFRLGSDGNVKWG